MCVVCTNQWWLIYSTGVYAKCVANEWKKMLIEEQGNRYHKIDLVRLNTYDLK